MINNAGITKDALLVKVQDGKVINKMSMDQWRAVVDVNLTGVFLGAREAAARMITLGNGGVIISTSSISARGQHGPVELLRHQGRRGFDDRSVGEGARALRHSHRRNCSGLYAHRNSSTR